MHLTMLFSYCVFLVIVLVWLPNSHKKWWVIYSIRPTHNTKRLTITPPSDSPEEELPRHIVDDTRRSHWFHSMLSVYDLQCRLYVSIGGWSILWVAFNSYIFPICYCIRVGRLWFLYTSLFRRKSIFLLEDISIYSQYHYKCKCFYNCFSISSSCLFR